MGIIANATLVSVSAKRFPAGRWSVFGTGSETKWYFICNEKPPVELHRVAELMIIKFSESGHPVFRATSPLSRGTLKSKGGQLSIHFCADEGSIETVFRTIMFVSSVFTEQSQMCVKNAILVKQERGDLYWQDNMIHCSRQQTY